MNVPPSPQLRPRPPWTAASLTWVLTASTFGCSTRSLPTTSRTTSSSGFSKILSNREPSAPSASAAAPTKSPLFWPNALLTAVLCNTSGFSWIPQFLIPQYRLRSPSVSTTAPLPTSSVRSTSPWSKTNHYANVGRYQPTPISATRKPSPILC